MHHYIFVISQPRLASHPRSTVVLLRKVEITMEGVPNELYAPNMEYRHQYDEIVKHFAEGRLKEAGAIQKDLQLHNVIIASYYTDDMLYG